MDKDTIARLTKLAEKRTIRENMGENDTMADWAGGNIDDAYDYGMGDGEIFLARTILEDEKIFFIKQ